MARNLLPVEQGARYAGGSTARRPASKVRVTVAIPSEHDWRAAVIVAARVITVAVLCAALYFGQAVLVPLVLAGLLTFLLAPLVTRLDRLHVPRVVGVLLVMTLVAGVIGGLGYVVTGQLQNFATELPTHRQNIRAKIRELQALTRGGAIENVQDTIEDINDVVDGEPPPNARDERPQEPVRVAVEEQGPPLLGNAQWLGPLFGAVGTVGLTLLLAIFMLIGREDLRDRLVSMSGRPSLVVATKAFADAGDMISRYLLMQFIINASMGLAVGVALYFIGVPYAALWGLAAAVLRYLPYVGPWIAALLPITVSLVTAPGWEQVAIVVVLFLVLELLSNNVMEPLLYGQSVGLSSLAVIVAAIFWTWLWGPIGLVIATPITACLVVLSSYVPALDGIGRLLGERPALKPHETLYQRLLARDADEAEGIIEREKKERSVDDACQLVLDTLLALKRDLQAGRVSAEDGESVLTALRESLEDLRTVGIDTPYDPDAQPPVLLIGAPGRDPLDALLLELVRVLVRDEPATLEVLSTDLMIGEAMAAIEAKAPAAVIIPSLPPAGLTPARHLCMRLHARIPRLVLIAARLGDTEGEVHERVALLEGVGCTDVPASLPALKSALQRIVRAALSGAPVPGAVLAAAGHR
jgi:predicted PurR-regulated permease PerM